MSKKYFSDQADKGNKMASSLRIKPQGGKLPTQGRSSGFASMPPRDSIQYEYAVAASKFRNGEKVTAVSHYHGDVSGHGEVISTTVDRYGKMLVRIKGQQYSIFPAKLVSGHIPIKPDRDPNV